MEFAEALGGLARRQKGFIEAEGAVITWCVGHLVTMSYPEKYDAKYKRWSLDTLPFLPARFLYEIIENVRAQYETVHSLLHRKDISCIYICTDSGREGEYIYRLVDEMAQVNHPNKKRVWIDSQTLEEIRRGIREAKDWREYDALSASAYLRAKEDYLMGINFSRLLTIKYGQTVAKLLKLDRAVLSVGRVMTCVLGMVVDREREIRAFEKTVFYKIMGVFRKDAVSLAVEWRLSETSAYRHFPNLYKENGFLRRQDAEDFCRKSEAMAVSGETGRVIKKEKKKEIKRPPLLYNLAELQNECAKTLKISPDACLKVVQGLYEKKMVTYPRTDARVLSTAVAREITKNIAGLTRHEMLGVFAKEILDKRLYTGLIKSRYVNDSQIGDHYAIIPTGAMTTSGRLSDLEKNIFSMIVRRFLSIFYPPAVYEKYQLEIAFGEERFFGGGKICTDKGYRILYEKDAEKETAPETEEEEESSHEKGFLKLRKNDILSPGVFTCKEGETTPPKRYTSGSMILAMENAGQLIEEEDLREQIRGSGIGTSATRAEILKKLFHIDYLHLQGKTQIITPTLFGEMVYEVVRSSIYQLLSPKLSASWEKGLTLVAQGSITSDEYMEKLRNFIILRTNQVMGVYNHEYLQQVYTKIAPLYEAKPSSSGKRKRKDSRSGGNQDADG